ncbi:MAG: MATE family efflux transporter [Kiritimatiellae bacterium]|nr:MATE family efflux transporter [Kiritimatiellia bacterium]
MWWLRQMWKRGGGAGGYREVWQVAAPIIVSMASFALMEFCDRIFLARHGSVSLRAALPAGILALTLTTFFQALAGYAGTFVAQYHGAGRKRECGEITAQGIWLGILTWPLGVALIPVGIALLSVAGHPPDMLAAEKIYLTILMGGCGFWSLTHAVSGFFSGRGDTRTPMRASLVANAANIALNYALIFGKWGFPAWGIAGAAVATVISSALGLGLLLVWYARPALRKEYGTGWIGRPVWRHMKPLLRFGTPAAVNAIQDIGAFAFFVVLLGRLSAVDMAASNIALSINTIAFMPLMGMGMAATIVVGQYQGARESATAARAGMTAMKMAWAYMGVVGASFLLMPRLYFALFTGDGEGMVAMAEVIVKGRWLLVLMALWGLVDAINLVVGGALRGAGDTRFTLLYTMAVTWLVWIPGELVLLLRFDAGLMAAWLWMTTYVCLLAGGLWWRFRKGRWMSIEMIRRKLPLTALHGGVTESAVPG